MFIDSRSTWVVGCRGRVRFFGGRGRDRFGLLVVVVSS